MALLFPWVRRTMQLLGAAMVLAVVLASGGFAWVAWLSPQARTGHRNQWAAHRVRPGMRPRQALALMGPPVAKEVAAQRVYYVYDAHPLASGRVTFWVGPDSLVAGVNHGE